jgi:glycerol-3-phosphate dehydrogenase
MFRRAIPRRNTVLATSAALTAAGSLAYFASPLLLDSSHPDTNQSKHKFARPSPLWSPPSRKQMIDSLKRSGKGDKVSKYPQKDDEEFDLLIVGGGATGAGSAVDAASRGLKVALVERDDFSSGELVETWPVLARRKGSKEGAVS